MARTSPYLCELAMLDRGYLRIARLRSVEVRVHWSVIAGALLSARLRIEPLVWLGYSGVLVAHQLGHAAAVASAGGRLLGLDTNAFGGSCRWRGTGTFLERSWVAWGGLLAQAALLALALLLGAMGVLGGETGEQLGYCFIEVNLALAALNLLPVVPLDGAVAWRLFGEWKAADRSVRRALFGWRRARRQGEPAQDLPGASPGAGGAPTPAGSAGSSAGRSPPPAEAPFDRAGSSHAPRLERRGRATPEDGSEIEEELLSAPRPSEQAQREIDALLRRVQDRAARSRRGR